MIMWINCNKNCNTEGICSRRAVIMVLRILGPKIKNQTVKLLEMTELVFFFYGCLPICKDMSGFKRGFNIGNYFWRAQVCLNTSTGMGLIIQIYFWKPNNMQKINFISQLILGISLTLVLIHFRHAWSHPL